MQQIQQSQAQSTQVSQVQSQVDEVIGIMNNNIEKVMARGEKLDTLQNKTDDLAQGAMQFKKGSKEVQNYMWWKNMKLNLIIGLIATTVIVIAIIGIVGIPKAGSTTASTTITNSGQPA
eukprot:jgi/Hompol1/6468/HPOL_004998-RA